MENRGCIHARTLKFNINLELDLSGPAENILHQLLTEVTGPYGPMERKDKFNPWYLCFLTIPIFDNKNHVYTCTFPEQPKKCILKALCNPYILLNKCTLLVLIVTFINISV